LVKVYQFLKSPKLTFNLLIALVALYILSTFIPQGRDLAFYYRSFAPALAWLIKGLDLHRFYTSWLMIIPLVFFLLNLSVCTAGRIVGHFRPGNRSEGGAGDRSAGSGGRRRFGPDIIHIGLLVLVVGGLMRSAGRREGMV
jgi:cytochrome c biogenesis protein ResB